ncbi:MAG: CHAT domain-containing protein [Okeania sp. SIO3I5]|uniref:CHAT domain-containing protein n=1 Tax=Okeania sp. SIO3I5 TaxID=2607805 RepID=UPI0013B83B31|nr:CHAT domain-containing protein [Okeania sp. SIO3I5]NEQ39662.1 CHAT domain-containing protein [Okeania sp. SIO3I5]
MKSESPKSSKAKTEIFRKIGNKNSEIKTKKSQVSKSQNSSERSTVYLSPIANIAARISPISYLAYLLLPPVAKAQPIKTSTDGTNTIVEKAGDRFNIHGGRLSKDGANLFHSFREFNLDKGQTASFSSTETIKNIITRVNGGNSSFINGLIEVKGGNPNLIIVNPAGILFGKNAQLNIPGALSATTATGIQFNNQWFSAINKNNYASLVGNPTAFTFPKEPAPIINNGNLEVKPGQNVTLMAGSVVNNGTITAPGGEIRIAAVPNQSIVRISQEGHLLNLEISSDRLPNTPDGQIDPLSLPQMLTGEGTRSHATKVTMNQNGQFILTGDETVATTPGSVVISGNIDASNTQFTNRSVPPLSQDNTRVVGGKVEILGDRIALNQANINVSGDGGGGTVNLSNYTVNQENNTNIYISSDSVISANANLTGRGGNVAIAGQQIDISGHISARGSGNLGEGGSVEISGGGSLSGTVDLSANNNVGEIRLESENITVNSENNFQVLDGENNQFSNLNISENSLEQMTNNADVTLAATNDITINNLSDNQLNLNADSQRLDTAQTQVKFVADSDQNRSGSFTIDNRTSIVNRSSSLIISGENLTVGKITNNGGGTIGLMSNQINFASGSNSINNVDGQVNVQPRYPTENMVINENINLEQNANSNLEESTVSSAETGELEDSSLVQSSSTELVNNESKKENNSLGSDITSDPKVPTINTQSANLILASLNRRVSLDKIDKIRSTAFANELNINLDNSPTITEKSIRESLTAVANQTGKKPAVIYIISQPEYLELILVTSEGSPIFQRVEAANNDELRQQMRSFIGGVSHPSPSNPNKYLTASQKLYKLLISPLEPELQKQGINTLLFSLDPAMRSIPFAALHDGEKFLIEKYSMGLIPSINMTDTSYKNIKDLSVLAMGASDFQDPNIVSLPAVPLELKMIRQNWRGKIFFDESFTLENLQKQRIKQGARIVHLATHGSFQPSAPNDSFIQLWNEQLKFDELRKLAKNGEPIELLVLSACETAFGNLDAELGFAGLAVQAGVKSVLASLWQVDDGGTLGLMREFYRQLSSQDTTVKAEALRQAQIAMINGELRLEAGRLRSGRVGDDGVKLPNAEFAENMSFSHPYYWASFMMIGTPW